jgi:hypothetical protein
MYSTWNNRHRFVSGKSKREERGNVPASTILVGVPEMDAPWRELTWTVPNHLAIGLKGRCLKKMARDKPLPLKFQDAMTLRALGCRYPPTHTVHNILHNKIVFLA